ncbi:hypothetical protein BBK82_37490 [Lentzea guizhouensis]|uniref:Uncharacterized protein n=1 Tax=Lentzea guizhouensis TaxID=1586287 RepID=A0A1B2HSX1_9PSEU|nr:hypothetical protein BBK82_37490 [Lentzea guizhouensis]
MRFDGGVDDERRCVALQAFLAKVGHAVVQRGGERLERGERTTAGDSCPKLQFWLIAAASASAYGAMPLGGPRT